MAYGFFITFEGGEGAGKSTQINRLAENLRADGYEVITTREPGGSPGAEAIRHVLLSGAAESMGTHMEALLFAAARSDHVEQVIRPAIAAGKVVLCDRFMDSSRVYQGVTGRIDDGLMAALERVTVNGMQPHLTFILDIDPEEGLRRAAARRATSDTPDRFEKETVDLHRQRREAFLKIAADEPERCIVIDASRSADEIADTIYRVVRAGLRAVRPLDERRDIRRSGA